MYVLEIEASKTPRFDLKKYQNHRNGLSVYHLALICSSETKKVKFSTQSAEKWICMGECAFEVLAD